LLAQANESLPEVAPHGRAEPLTTKPTEEKSQTRTGRAQRLNWFSFADTAQASI